jgi:hypothetical protein
VYINDGMKKAEIIKEYYRQLKGWGNKYVL